MVAARSGRNASLVALPSHLMAKIASHLVRPDILAFALTCRAICGSTTAQLWRDIDASDALADASLKERRFTTGLEVLQVNDDLARLVQRLTIRPTGDSADELVRLLNVLRSHLHQLTVVCTAKEEHPAAAGEPQLDPGVPAFLARFLLGVANFPRLTSLTIDGARPSHVITLLRRTPALRTLVYRRPICQDYPSQSIALPSLEHLIVPLDPSTVRFAASLVHNAPELRGIHLTHFKVTLNEDQRGDPVTELAIAIRQAKALKTLYAPSADLAVVGSLLEDSNVRDATCSVGQQPAETNTSGVGSIPSLRTLSLVHHGQSLAPETIQTLLVGLDTFLARTPNLHTILLAEPCEGDFGEDASNPRVTIRVRSYLHPSGLELFDFCVQHSLPYSRGTTRDKLSRTLARCRGRWLPDIAATILCCPTDSAGRLSGQPGDRNQLLPGAVWDKLDQYLYRRD